MRISVNQRTLAVQRKTREWAGAACGRRTLRRLWCAMAVLLAMAAGSVAYAQDKSPQDAAGQSARKSETSAKNVSDPNDLWWSKWDAAIRDPNNPVEMLEAKWNAIAALLQNKEPDPDPSRKKKIIDKIVSPIIDTELMAKLVLGRTHWPKLTVPQQKRFTELFAVRLKNFYLDKTSLYQDEKVFFKPAVQARTGIQVPMTLISNEKEVSILYKLHKTGDGWKIFDVEIEGISILMTYRSQFDDMLRKGSVQSLLSELEKPAVP